MNKSSIKNFAITSRRLLLAAVERKAYEYCITRDGDNSYDAPSFAGRLFSDKEQEQRRQLIDRIKRKGFDQVMEEAAYTWFNRFIALRFMEVNGYLPSKVRVFSDENGLFKPEIMSCAAFVDIDGIDREKVLDMIELQQNEELFKYLIIAQCNELSAGLPYMFEKISNWTELLFPNNLLRDESVIHLMITTIPEKDWTEQVQIIGWLYQYYNAELKDETFSDLKKNIKITKERIPAATQLFTPDWIVRYMTENSLGRLWYEGHREFDRSRWRYYIDEAEQEESVEKQLSEIRISYSEIKPEEIKIIDPCMGSGHILVYAFDVLMDIYTSAGWTERDAALSILNNNLYGLDIDDRAGQIAYFAVMMKARKYNRRILNGEAKPHLSSISDSYFMSEEMIDLVSGGDSETRSTIELLRSTFENAKEYGSIIKMPQTDLETLYEKTDSLVSSYRSDVSGEKLINDIKEYLLPLIDQARTMSRKYDAVITNPPYMGASGMGVKLTEYIKKNYPDSKSDLFAVFLEHGNTMTKKNGYNCMVTMQSWMFLSSFEDLRKKLISSYDITNLMHMENMVLGIAFGTAVTVFRNSHIEKYKGTYNQIKLKDIENEVPFEFPVKRNRFYQISTTNFSKIPGSPVAYWASLTFIEACNSGITVKSLSQPKTGMTTGDNNRFLRIWTEVPFKSIKISALDSNDAQKSGAKWFPYLKGGEFRRWFGNNDYIVNWYNNGFEIKSNIKPNGLKAASVRSEQLYFKPLISWSAVSSSIFSCRFIKCGALFDSGGSSLYLEKNNYYVLALLNSKIAQYSLNMTNPTINYQPGDIAGIPLKISCSDIVEKISQHCVDLSKSDWDSFETSWDFKRHPLI